MKNISVLWIIYRLVFKKLCHPSCAMSVEATVNFIIMCQNFLCYATGLQRESTNEINRFNWGCFVPVCYLLLCNRVWIVVVKVSLVSRCRLKLGKS